MSSLKVLPRVKSINIIIVRHVKLESVLFQLVPLEIYQKHLTLSLVEAESRSANSFHCQTPNCIGWCIYEDDINLFTCEVCGKVNCLTCKAIHEGISCKQYQDDVKIKARNDVAAKQTQDKLEVSGEFFVRTANVVDTSEKSLLLIIFYSICSSSYCRTFSSVSVALVVLHLSSSFYGTPLTDTFFYSICSSS